MRRSLPVTALWSEAARSGQGLRAFGQAGEQTTLAELEEALNAARPFRRRISSTA